MVAMPDPRLGERACAFAVLREGASLTLARTGGVPARAAPVRATTCRSGWKLTQGLPKTPSGKIQKVHLRTIAKDYAA